MAADFVQDRTDHNGGDLQLSPGMPNMHDSGKYWFDPDNHNKRYHCATISIYNDTSGVDVMPYEKDQHLYLEDRRCQDNLPIVCRVPNE